MRTLRPPPAHLWSAIACAAFVSCTSADVPTARPDAGRSHPVMPTGPDGEGQRLDAGVRDGGGTVGGDPCRASLVCADCVLKYGCGWCPENGLCEAGNQNGPSSGSCQGFS